MRGKAYAVTRTSTATLNTAGHDVTLAAGASQELIAWITGHGKGGRRGKKEGKPVAGVMVVLIPKDPEAHREYFGGIRATSMERSPWLTSFPGTTRLWPWRMRGDLSGCSLECFRVMRSMGRN